MNPERIIASARFTALTINALLISQEVANLLTVRLHQDVARGCTPVTRFRRVGQIPSNGFKAQNKRYRHKTNPDTGSVYGRHFASSFDDCVKSCQWAGGNTGCRSVNYGTLAGQPVCELLSIAVTKGSPLEAWLVDAPGWQYALVSSS